KVWLRPREVYALKLGLNVTSNYFKPGHRIRLEISSSNFPRFDRNMNTGGRQYDETSWVVAENTVQHSAQAASYLLLPVIPDPDPGRASLRGDARCLHPASKRMEIR